MFSSVLHTHTNQVPTLAPMRVHLPTCMCHIHSIATRVIKLAHTKSSVALAPALVETYSRLLVYMEIESLGIKGFISKTNFAAVAND